MNLDKPVDLMALDKILREMKVMISRTNVSPWDRLRDEWQSHLVHRSMMASVQERRINIDARALMGHPGLGEILEKMGRECMALTAEARANGNWRPRFAVGDGFVGLAPGFIDCDMSFEIVEFQKPGREPFAEEAP